MPETIGKLIYNVMRVYGFFVVSGDFVYVFLFICQRTWSKESSI